LVKTGIYTKASFINKAGLAEKVEPITSAVFDVMPTKGDLMRIKGEVYEVSDMFFDVDAARGTTMLKILVSPSADALFA